MFKKISQVIVNHPKTVVILYILIAIICFFLMLMVDINIDNASYMPDHANSKQGMDMLDSEFAQGGTANLLLKDAHIADVLVVKGKIEVISGVDEVIWLDNFVDVKVAEEFIEQEYLDEFYKDGNALLTITFTEGNDTNSTHSAIEKIYELIENNDNAFLAGSAASSKSTLDSIQKEVPIYTVVAVVLILIILFLSTTSYLEPFIFLFAVGVAIIINLGTNIFQGEISQITFSAASILQLAVSMDYSIFLLHRFHEERSKGIDVAQAMVNSMSLSFRAIFASAATTIAGFTALVFMDYGIGQDMGVVLAKGIFFSLIVVMTLLPAAVILLDKWIERFTHRELKLEFKKLGGIISKFKYIGIVLAIVIAFFSFQAQANVEYYYGYDNVISNKDITYVAKSEIEETYGKSNTNIIIVPKEGKLKESLVLEELADLANVANVQGLYNLIGIELPEFMLPDSIIEMYQSDKYSMFTLSIEIDEESDEAFQMVEDVREVLAKNYDEWYTTGGSFAYKDLADVTDSDFALTNLLSVLFIYIIVMITFRSLLIPLIAIFVIELAIWVNTGISFVFDEPMSFMSILIIGAIQLGATVDYAILFISRYRENLDEMNISTAIKKTIQDVGKSILTSGGILVAATFSVYFIATMEATREMCLLIGRGAIISMISVIILLPAFLLVFDRLIGVTTIGWPKQGKKRRRRRKNSNQLVEGAEN